MTTKEGKKLAGMGTMSTGTTPNKIETGASLDLHGHKVTVIVTDDQETVVAYANRAQRIIGTAALNALAELGTFPTGTQLIRPVTGGSEQAVIIAVTGDCCYQVNIVEPVLLQVSAQTLTYNQFMEWHQGGLVVQKELELPAGELYVPKPLTAEARAEIEQVANEEAANLGEWLASSDDANPFEADLNQRVRDLEKQLAEMEIESQKRINALTEENFQLTTAIGQQASMHATVIAAYEEDIARLEKKAAILNRLPSRMAVCTLVQQLAVPERRREADTELAEKLSDCWTVLNITVVSEPGEITDSFTRFVTLTRDLPLPAAGDSPTAAAESNRPIRSTPLPVGQTVLPTTTPGQPVSRALTHNRPRPGDTKRIPALQRFQERQARDSQEIDAILQGAADRQVALQMEIAAASRSFPVIGDSNHD